MKAYKAQAAAGASEGEKAAAVALGPKVEEKSLVRDLAATLIVVHGGDAIAPLLGVPPSFLVSGACPAMYGLIQTAIEWAPTVPDLSLNLEFPLSFLDALSRTLLLVQIIPGMVLSSPYPQIADSPWALLVTSLFTANAGFFVLNLTNFLHPTPLSLTTPLELLPYGWTAVDLWCAPLVTGLYSLLTHAQPFWGTAHAAIFGWLSSGDEKLAPVDYETARAACTVVLMALFSARAVRNYGGMKH